MNWTLGGFIALAASAGLLSAAFTAGLSGIGALWARRRHARYLALRMSVEMDAYFHHCLDQIADINAHNSSGGHHGQLRLELHKPPILPDDDIGWINLDSRLSDRTLSLGPRISYMNGVIRSELEHHHFNHEEDPDASTALSFLYQVAQDAYILAQDLRNQYDFTPLEHSDRSYQWMLDAKANHKTLVEKEEEIQRVASKKMWTDMQSLDSDDLSTPK